MWDKGFHPVLVGFILGPELGPQPIFFNLELAHERNEHERKADESLKSPQRNRGAE